MKIVIFLIILFVLFIFWEKMEIVEVLVEKLLMKKRVRGENFFDRRGVKV